MLVTNREQRLCQILRDFPDEHKYRYTDFTGASLRRALFRSLAAENDDYLDVLFRGRVPNHKEEWSLSKAQGVTEDMEYTEAARGKPCGHIYKNGDTVYRCKTCTTDDTCVLCTRCFEASDHTGHVVTQSISLGNSGCCDCGDDEAWKTPVKCAIHTAETSRASGKKPQAPSVPADLLESIRMTVGRAMDYLIDVISCSPENLRLGKTEQSIRLDEEQARLGSVWYNEPEPVKPEFALVLWNDEKHTVPEVQNQLARACKQKEAFGLQKANETNDMGRSVVKYSDDIKHLLQVAKVIEQIKITVTIRSSRDTFREQMCGSIIEWLGDIAGCSVGEEHDILRQTICEELLKSWRQGSEGSNRMIGKDGLDDHEIEESVTRREDLLALGAHRRFRALRTADDSDSDANTIENENENDDEIDDTDSQLNVEDLEMDEMDLDVLAATSNEGDLEMSTPGELEDETEVSEATYAGYPPPPPPPSAPSRQTAGDEHGRVSVFGSDHGEPSGANPSLMRTNIEIPLTPQPNTSRRKNPSRAPGYWLEQPERNTSAEQVALYEDLSQRVRLDWMLLYDLRLWKKVRIDLRDLYISTVVSVPKFKRIIGLRFAGLYSVLGQLYLIADREPDHSIINLSVQTFTTPSITQEVIERGNFLTLLFSMLYTFLTKRQVQHPKQVSVDDTLAFETSSVANRRMYHFFTDLRHMFGVQYVQSELRTKERYVLQFLDLIRLPQGTCPNIRATGDHVEYESDVWISAQILTKEINKLCRQFAEIFGNQDDAEKTSLARVLRIVAKASIVNSVGAERLRFHQAEIKAEVRFKSLAPFHFEDDSSEIHHKVVDFVVETEAISFHHALHYTLSWLIDSGKDMSPGMLKDLLTFSAVELKQHPPYKTIVPSLGPEDYLMAVYDFPLRVCAWLAQMKAGMWVRNGLSLRHQMTTYRGVSHRDLAHHRDIFLLQTAMVTCNPSRVLASMIERFGMDEWMRGRYDLRSGFEPNQQLDVAEDLIHLLIVILSDRTSLQPSEASTNAQAVAIRRDIAHILCFKPLSFSELNNRFTDKATDLEEFQDLLEEMTVYRPPEGLSDTGTFELKREYLADVDPYTAHYTKNQRDEAENAYRSWMARRSGKPAAEIVFEPRLAPIGSGVFTHLMDFTKTPIFAQIIFYSLAYAWNPHLPPEIPSTRIEAYLHIILHLVLAAILEDDEPDGTEAYGPDSLPSFVNHILRKKSELDYTIFDMLIQILESSEFKGCHPKTRLIIHRIKQRRPQIYNEIVSDLYSEGKRPPAVPFERLGFDTPATPSDDDQEAKQRQATEMKKKQAIERQAKVMAQFQVQQQDFLNNQDIVDWDDSDELESLATNEDYRKMWRFPAGNCILCQEETNDTRLFGTFALLTNSTVFRQTDVWDADFLGEAIDTPGSLDRSAEDRRPFGVASQNRITVAKRRADGYEFTSEHQGLAKGFPPEWSARGPVSTGCGHIMHYSCFDTYCTATQRRQAHQIARQHPERTDLKEFVCPLCKALGNAFLPIIWRGNEESYPSVLQTETSFDEWLSSGVGITVTRCLKGQQGRSSDSRHQDLFVSYTSKKVIPPLAIKLPTLINSPQVLTSPLSPQSSIRSSMPGFFPIEEAYSMISPSHSLSVGALLVDELLLIYTRLQDTLKANRLSSQFDYPSDISMTPEYLSNTDTLTRILGFSIAAAEIAQRGIRSEPGQTLLDKLPSAVETHLRILSETVSSYIAIGGMRNSGNNLPASEFASSTRQQLSQLFGGHPQINSNDLGIEFKPDLPAALSQDSFVFLAECSFNLAPSFGLDIHHIIHLCYLLEIVKVTLYLTIAPDTFEACQTKMKSDTDNHNENIDLVALQAFLGRLSTFSSPQWPIMTYREQPGGEVLARVRSPAYHTMLYKALSAYALAFLRKVVILLNVRYAVDFSNAGSADTAASEIVRLTRVLRLPTLPSILGSIGDPDNPKNSTLSAVILGWVQHWQYEEQHRNAFGQPLALDRCHAILAESAYHSLRPGHPAIFELIGLPKHYDTLTYEVTRRRCPTKGNKMEDAALCLFCGAFFCSQALCCTKEDKGGCYQHMQKCGIDVGLFLNIRKCTVLYLHNRNGSWNLAPYLDKYGESDPGLRRGRQLFLNQKRYDALFRNVWLQQGIPTMIARKLEAEINNGGWETL